MSKLVMLAVRSLLRNRRRSLITLAAITVGVGVVVFANAFASGFVAFMKRQAIEGRAGAIQVHAKGYLDANEAAPLKLDMPYDAAMLEKLKTTPGVTAVAPRIRFGGMVSNGSRSTMIMGQAIDPENEFKVCPDRMNEITNSGQGKHISADDAQGGVVGGEMAKSFAVHVGDSLTVNAAGREGQVNAQDVTLRGITGGAGVMESKRIVTIPLSYAQQLLQMQGRVTEYAVAVKDPGSIEQVASSLRERLGPDYEVSTWEEVMPIMRDLVNRIRIILRGISFVLFVIVIFGVVNTMLMSVFERVREIGTMLAVGMRRKQVLRLFLLESAALGLMGGGLGAILGFAASSAIAVNGILISPPGAAVKQLIRPIPDLQTAMIALVVAVIGAVLAALYPARKASRMDPVEALRTL